MGTEQLQQLVTEMLAEAIADATRKNAETTAWQDDDLLTDAQAAQVLNIAKGTLPVWRHHGRGPPWVKICRSVRYQFSDLLEYIENQRVFP